MSRAATKRAHFDEAEDDDEKMVDEVQDGEEEEGEEEEGEEEEGEEEEEEEEANGEEEGSTTEDDSDEEEDEEEEESALLSFVQQQAAVPRIEDATSRLAVVNCDWEQVRAVDLLAVLRSFVPSGGSIHSVRVYLSDFGAEQQREEEAHGPSGIYQNGGDGDGEEEEAEEEEGVVQGGKVDNEKLRKYELERYKHYYAVVSCDTVRTAEVLYNECDGAELEASSMVLDLRFIPEEMTFERALRDEAREVPPKYKLPSFAASALQNSTVTPSWDQDDTQRKQAMQKNFKKTEMREVGYSAYL